MTTGSPEVPGRPDRPDVPRRPEVPGRPEVPVRPDVPRRLDLDKLFAARLHAARVRPYLATALFALHTVESRTVPTMAVDRYWRCYVSPVFVDRTPVEELAGVWVHEVSHLLRDHHGRSDRFAREHGLTGAAERLRMNIAADCEINDDTFGDGLARPEGAVEPGLLRLPEGKLMEEYLLRFRLGPHTAHLAWLDCGSGADGLERGGTWALRARTASPRRNGTRSGSGWRRASGAGRGTARGDGSGGRRRRSIRRSRGGSCWERRCARRRPVPVWARTTPTVVRRAGRPGCRGLCCRACGAGRRGSAWSSTRPDRSVTRNWAARCWRSPRSPGPWGPPRPGHRTAVRRGRPGGAPALQR